MLKRHSPASEEDLHDVPFSKKAHLHFNYHSIVFFFSFTLHASQQKYYQKTIEEYQVPEVTLLNQDGAEIQLKQFLDTDKPVLLDFIYGTCTTICPILSVGFSYFQKQLDGATEQVRMVSITIDPDSDTPDVMKEYLKKYNSKPGWSVLTGKRENVIEVLQEFDAYVTNKMDHFPLTLLKAPGQKKWVRLYGLLNASDLVAEYEALINK